LSFDFAGSFKPIHLGHPQVHQHQIGPQALAKLYRLPTVASLSHHNEVWPLAQHLPDRCPKEGVIVGYYEPRRPELPLFFSIIHLSQPLSYR
jgi:hypothetical protein